MQLKRLTVAVIALTVKMINILEAHIVYESKR